MSRTLSLPSMSPGGAALAGAAVRLPPLPARGGRRDGPTSGQRAAMVGAILCAHGAALWGVMQIQEVRDAVAEVAPMFVSLIAPERPPEPVRPPPPPPQAAPTPIVKRPPPVIAAAPSPAPAAFEAPAPSPAPQPTPEPPAPPVVMAAPSPVPAPPAPPAPPPAPKVIPASAVQYLEPIELVYPRVSKRLGETGRVLVRVFIDTTGAAKNVQVERSSSHPRLDEAAVSAVQKARFKPYTENGQAVAGWAFIPLEFELEK